MSAPCWDVLCGPDCAYCPYKQARYRQGFSQPCYEWFRARKISKNCKDCSYYQIQRGENPSLPEDPAFH